MVLSCILAAICFVGCDEQNSHLHSFDSWTVLKEATCTESGEKEGVCACGEKMTQQIPALGHSYDETIDKEATCLEVGSKTCVCTRCGDEKTEVIRALGHSYELTDSKNATCTEAGSKTYVCQRCGEERTEEIPARGHYWIPATCTKEKYCSRCQATEGSPLGHNYSNGKCTRCGKEKVGEVVVLNSMPMTLSDTVFHTAWTITNVSYKFVNDYIKLLNNTADINRLREKLLKDYNRYAVYYEGIPPYYEEYPQRQPKTGEIQWDSDENGACRRTNKKIGRNDPCPCGSGKKYKNCCGR